MYSKYISFFQVHSHCSIRAETGRQNEHLTLERHKNRACRAILREPAFLNHREQTYGSSADDTIKAEFYETGNERRARLQYGAEIDMAKGQTYITMGKTDKRTHRALTCRSAGRLFRATDAQRSVWTSFYQRSRASSNSREGNVVSTEPYTQFHRTVETMFSHVPQETTSYVFSKADVTSVRLAYSQTH